MGIPKKIENHLKHLLKLTSPTDKKYGELSRIFV
jgi:hypothetical protein